MHTFILDAVPTGSLALTVKIDGPVPDEVRIHLESGDDELLLGPLTLHDGAYEGWYYASLTEPVAWDVEFIVSVLFDDVIIHTFDEPIILAEPISRRVEVVRQRLHELLLEGYLTEQIEAQVYGSPHKPSTVGSGFNCTVGTTLELKPGYLDSLQIDTESTQESSVTIPLFAYGAVDDAEDTELISSDLEEALRWLLDQDWHLSHFGVIQTSCQISSSAPQVDDKSARIEASLSLTLYR